MTVICFKCFVIKIIFIYLLVLSLPGVSSKTWITATLLLSAFSFNIFCAYFISFHSCLLKELSLIFFFRHKAVFY